MFLALQQDQCFDDPDEFDVHAPLPLVDCDEPHDNEVYAVVEHPAAGPKEDFPGDAEMERFAEEACEDQFERRVDPAVADSVGDFFIWPDEFTWLAGHQAATCVLFDLDLAELVGSMQVAE